jgi:hypothetical protein
MIAVVVQRAPTTHALWWLPVILAVAGLAAAVVAALWRAGVPTLILARSALVRP